MRSKAPNIHCVVVTCGVVVQEDHRGRLPGADVPPIKLAPGLPNTFIVPGGWLSPTKAGSMLDGHT